MNTNTKAPTWFKVVAILAIIWNIMGVMAYLGQAMMGPEAMEALPEEQQELYQNIPAWATAAFALAVWGGLVGSIMLFMRKSAAKFALWISLIGIVVNDIYNFMVIDAVSLFGMTALYMQLFVLIVGIYLIVLYNQAKSKGWIA